MLWKYDFCTFWQTIIHWRNYLNFFPLSSMHFRTHHIWRSTTELILVIYYPWKKLSIRNIPCPLYLKWFFRGVCGSTVGGYFWYFSCMLLITWKTKHWVFWKQNLARNLQVFWSFKNAMRSLVRNVLPHVFKMILERCVSALQVGISGIFHACF